MPRLKGYRFPREVVAYAIWAYHRFALSTADVEDLLAERGITVSRETDLVCISPNASSVTVPQLQTNGIWMKSSFRSAA